jgi:hypothetical protein
MQLSYLKQKGRGSKDLANSQDKKRDDDNHLQRLRPDGLISSQKNAWDIA